ncbi:type III-A CRISPR-associated RAMP protein Csm4 [candidate division Kazan bacterium]|uniref:CRISPR system Cms protein Csm4 n=1 Tax=candidate division Kazan bacterium TaxID=2202143 RepID=A0A420ZCG3_UNCK3|nr:MAG: type III-A CRISPR-associated RAMP protein Csm4 [candidate division Kazan bacterium]
MKIIKLINKTALPENVDNIRLFGAIYNTLIELNKEKANVFRDKINNGKIKITSAFPFIKNKKNGKNILFFPKPKKPEKITDSLRISVEVFNYMKEFKNIKYVSEEDLSEFIKHKVYDEKFAERFVNKERAKENKLEIERVTIPRNVLDRITMKSMIFYEHYIYIKGGGLWFGVEADDEDFKNIIRPALALLKDRGIGPNYSVGFGQFEFEVKEIKMGFDFNNYNGFLSLSKIIPTVKDIKGFSGFWDIKEMKSITRNGYHISPINMFTEGSVFNKKIDGSLREIIKNEYIVNGKAFLIPCFVGVDENEN